MLISFTLILAFMAFTVSALVFGFFCFDYWLMDTLKRHQQNKSAKITLKVLYVLGF